MRTKKSHRLSLIAIILLGMAIRAYHCHDRSMYLDEATTWRACKFTWLGTVSAAAADNHPPLHFLVLKLWMGVFGDSLLAMRSLSILMSGVAMAAIYVAVMNLQRSTTLGYSLEVEAARPAALLTIALFALNSVHAFIASEARMYMLGGALLALSSAALLRALDDTRGFRSWLPYIGFSVACVYTHYYLLFSLAAQGAFLGVLAATSRADTVHTLRRAKSKQGLLAIGCVFLLFVPWIPVLGRQVAQVSSTWWMKALTVRSVWELWYALFWPSIPGMDGYLAPPAGLALAFWCVTFGLALAVLVRRRGLLGIFVALNVVFPWACGVGLSLAGSQNVIRIKYMFFAKLFVFPAIAFLALMLPRRWMRISAAGGLLMHGIHSVILFYTTVIIANRPDIPAALRFIESRPKGTAVLIHPFDYLRAVYHSPDHENWFVYAENGRIEHYEGRAFLTDSDRQLSAAQLENLAYPRAVVVDSEFLGVRVPASWRVVERRFFERAEDVKELQIRVTEYALDGTPGRDGG